MTYNPVTALPLSANIRTILLGPESAEAGWYVTMMGTPALTTRDMLPRPVRFALHGGAWVPADPTTIAEYAARTFGHDARVSMGQASDGSWEYALRFTRNGEPAVIYGCGPTRHDAAIDLLKEVTP